MIFTDETNGSETPDIGRSLVLPLAVAELLLGHHAR